ncbi:MAG: hypothetical protein ACE5JA_10685, partial [bacterium]
MKRLALMLILFSAIGALAFLSFHGLMGAEVQNQSKNVQRLRREWQRLAVKAGKEVDPECCVVDPCTYCLLNKEDGLCTCADDLNLGKEVCPECLGKWLNRRGSTHSWPGFRRVYPDLASWLIAQGGPPALCPMVSGRGGPMGMMSGQGGPIGMMRMPFGRQRRGT